MKMKSIPMVVLVLVVVSALFGACATEAVPAIPAENQKGEIVIGVLDALSGAMAATYVEQIDGELDGIRYINEEKGGILGHPLKGVVIDHKMDNALALAGWDRLKNDGAPVILSRSAVVVRSIAAGADMDHIPVVAAGGTMDDFFPKEQSFYFALAPQFAGIFDSVCNVVEKDWAQKGETRLPKVGFDVPAMGTYPTMMSKAAKIYTEKRGWQHLVTRTYLSPADVTTQVIQMKEFGADYIYLNSTEAAMITWIKELDRQNFHPVIFGINSLGSQEMWNALGELCIGKMSWQYAPYWGETNQPLISLLHELNSQWYPDVSYRGFNYTVGFAFILVVAEALEKAISEVGYESIDGDAMKEAMETIRDFDPGIGMGYTWTPTDHQGLQGHRWYMWTEEGTLVPVSDWYTFPPLPEEQKNLAWWLKD